MNLNNGDGVIHDGEQIDEEKEVIMAYLWLLLPFIDVIDLLIALIRWHLLKITSRNLLRLRPQTKYWKINSDPIVQDQTTIINELHKSLTEFFNADEGWDEAVEKLQICETESDLIKKTNEPWFNSKIIGVLYNNKFNEYH